MERKASVDSMNTQCDYEDERPARFIRGWNPEVLADMILNISIRCDHYSYLLREIERDDMQVIARNLKTISEYMLIHAPPGVDHENDHQMDDLINCIEVSFVFEVICLLTNSRRRRL